MSRRRSRTASAFLEHPRAARPIRLAREAHLRLGSDVSARGGLDDAERLARLAGNGPSAGILGEPFRPVGPPGARMLLGHADPFIEGVGGRLVGGPELILHL